MHYAGKMFGDATYFLTFARLAGQFILFEVLDLLKAGIVVRANVLFGPSSM